MSVGINPDSTELSTQRLGSDSVIAQSRELIEEHNDLVQSIQKPPSQALAQNDKPPEITLKKSLPPKSQPQLTKADLEAETEEDLELDKIVQRSLLRSQ